ncbi:secretion/conjugation apparatus DotM-related subunit [Pseudomonas amygdali]|uniref:secretion/conjugation apparatus DotM-related subunit n=1 Tax=Pseudomonas amygdali TaxID=47877 RepID=UPI0006E6F2BD|nr:hypothetical protein [Pseudomonas amygdali]KPY55711.1 hypothetical protein ALO93_200143 [Pseudomonas amygdali pv. sesami]
MKQQGGGQKSFTWADPEILLLMIGGVYAMCWGAWYFAHEKIAMIYTYIRYVQLWIFSALGEAVDLPGISAIHGWVQRACAPDGIIGACNRDFSTMPWGDLTSSSMFMNGAYFLIMIYACVRMFIRVNKTHPKMRFTKTHNIKSFVDESKSQYPHLRMFSEIDLIAQPLDHPVFGMSLTSRQFAFVHRLIAGWKEESDRSWTPTLDREKTTEVMRKQLGKHWTKSANLSVGETLLVAIAVPRVAATDSTLDDAAFKSAMADSEYMLEWCWDQFVPPSQSKPKKGDPVPEEFAWLKPDIDLEIPRKIIQKYLNHPNVNGILHKHAFVRTIIFALFTQARRLGVLPPAEMRWMRFFDRELWYALQTIGRQAGFPEAPAVLSHFLYESKQGSALPEPQLDKAVNGLETAMTAFKYLEADKIRYEKEGAETVAP